MGFNGTDEYVDVPYLAALNPAQVTVEAWAYPTGGQGTYRSIVTSRDYAPGNARGYILYASSANTWQLWLGNGDWTVVYGPPIVLNQWTHLVGTYDGTTARLYVNGALAAFSTTTYLQNALRPLRIASGATDKTSPHTTCWTRRRGRRLRQRALRCPRAGALRGRRTESVELVAEELDVIGERLAHEVDRLRGVVLLVARVRRRLVESGKARVYSDRGADLAEVLVETLVLPDERHELLSVVSEQELLLQVDVLRAAPADVVVEGLQPEYVRLSGASPRTYAAVRGRLMTVSSANP